MPQVDLLLQLVDGSIEAHAVQLPPDVCWLLDAAIEHMANANGAILSAGHVETARAAIAAVAVELLHEAMVRWYDLAGIALVTHGDAKWLGLGGVLPLAVAAARGTRPRETLRHILERRLKLRHFRQCSSGDPSPLRNRRIEWGPPLARDHLAILAAESSNNTRWRVEKAFNRLLAKPPRNDHHKDPVITGSVLIVPGFGSDDHWSESLSAIRGRSRVVLMAHAPRPVPPTAPCIVVSTSTGHRIALRDIVGRLAQLGVREVDLAICWSAELEYVPCEGVVASCREALVDTNKSYHELTELMFGDIARSVLRDPDFDYFDLGLPLFSIREIVRSIVNVSGAEPDLGGAT